MMKHGVGFFSAGSPLGSRPPSSREWMLRSAAISDGRVALGPALTRASTNGLAWHQPKTAKESCGWSDAAFVIQSWKSATPGMLRSSLLKYNADPSSENTFVGLPEMRSLKL